MTKYTAAGETTELETTQITLKYTRKLGEGYTEKYGSEEASIFFPVTIEPGAGIGDIETALLEGWAFAKSTVLTQLGLLNDVQGNNVVAQIAPDLGPIADAAPRFSAAETKAQAKDELWADYFENPNNWFDNRETAQGKQPQFKAKRSSKYDGKGLWIQGCPEWVKAKLNGASV